MRDTKLGLADGPSAEDGPGLGKAGACCRNLGQNYIRLLPSAGLSGGERVSMAQPGLWCHGGDRTRM